VAGNHITAGTRSTGDGIVLATVRGDGMDRCQVVNNQIVGVGGAGILIQTRLRSAMIKQNMVEARPAAATHGRRQPRGPPRDRKQPSAPDRPHCQ
jgi:hypothetical protein